MKDRDFSKVQFKVNCSGSWANLVLCDVGRYDEVKAACEVIAKSAAAGGVRFRACDAEGGVIEQYGPTRPNGINQWHEPGHKTRF